MERFLLVGEIREEKIKKIRIYRTIILKYVSYKC